MTPATLSKYELDAVLKCVSPTGTDYGGGRIARRLAFCPGVRTRVVNQDCSVGNISDIVNKSINPHIEHLGLYVACYRPPIPFRNRHNQKTGEVLWAWFRDEPAANDADYDDPEISGLRRELDELEDAHPSLAVSARWNDVLEAVE